MNYKELNGPEEFAAAAKLSDAWKDATIPQIQWEQNEAEYRKIETNRWHDVAPFTSFIKACESLPYAKNDVIVGLLDIGASSGFYGALLKKAGYDWRYYACDYSPAFRDFALAKYPGIYFDVADASRLPYQDHYFEVVLSGCYLLHMYNWQAAVKEAARVSRKYVIFHRTPILDKKMTSYYLKEAYGVQCLEIHFSRSEFESTVKAANLSIEAVVPVFQNADRGGYGHYAYVCKKL